MMLTTLALFALTALRPDDPTRARAEQRLDQLFSPDDYPAEALRQGAEGSVRFELKVDAAGRVEDCKILVSSNNAALDRTTCDILRTRARFTPARDAHGKAVADTVAHNVRWQIQAGGPAMPFALTQVGATVAMTSAGLRCIPLGNLAELTPPLEGDDCAAAMGAYAAIAEAGGNGTEVNLQSRLVPDGASDPGALADVGLMLFELEADLVIGPDGRVTGCEVRRMDVSGMLETASPPDLCTAGLARARFEATSEERPRSARLHMAVSVNRRLEI